MNVRHDEALKPDLCAFAGAAEFLHRLHDPGLVVVVVSSAPRQGVDDMLEIVGAGDAIDAVVHADERVRTATDDQPSPATGDVGAGPTALIPSGRTGHARVQQHLRSSPRNEAAAPVRLDPVLLFGA